MVRQIIQRKYLIRLQKRIGKMITFALRLFKLAKFFFV